MRTLCRSYARAFVRGFASGAVPERAQSGRTLRFWLPSAALGGAAAGGAVWLATSEHPASSAKLVIQFPLRLARDVATAIATVAGKPISRRLCYSRRRVLVY